MHANSHPKLASFLVVAVVSVYIAATATSSIATVVKF